MRSYYSHLETAMGTPPTAIAPRPVFRSSAIFPVFRLPGISSRILFLGYWILKKHIHEIGCVITLRSEEGKMLSRRLLNICDARTYRIELAEELDRADMSSLESFVGSLEVEFFSSTNLVFPYPATAINYYGASFSSVVHTAQRVYNDFEDRSKNSQTSVPESGFNIYADDEKEPFIGLINGAEEVPECTIRLEFYNHENRLLQHEMHLGRVGPYETKILYPARDIPLKEFLNGKIGAAKAHFTLEWIFPRLVVGNIQRTLPALAITHTYYDCTDAASASDYWRPAEPTWHPASLMIPVSIADARYTNIYFYPIYSPSVFTLDIEIYDAKGVLLGFKAEVLTIASPAETMQSVSLNSLCGELGITPQKSLGARLIARPAAGSKLPARIKLGLDLGTSSKGLPCNICTNLQPFNPPLESKPRSFRWGPVLADLPEATIWIMNSAPHIDYRNDASVDLTFFREQDTVTLQRKLTLPPHGFIVISSTADSELKEFLNGTIGWYTASITNPYSTTYYFSNSPSGFIGGDHGF